MYKPGTTYNIPFEVKNAANALADPDAAALPTAVLWYDATPLGVACTVTKISTGLYAAAVPIPASPTCALGKTIKLRITANVGGSPISGFEALGVLSDAAADIGARVLVPRAQANGSGFVPTYDDFAYAGYSAAICGNETADTGATAGTQAINDWLGSTVKTLVLTTLNLSGTKVPFKRV
jgi:hypothetical protein